MNTVGRRLLVVEDSATQALKLRLAFEQQGWVVECADSAETALLALAAMTAAPPDLIVLDLHLPGMRGDEFCRQLRMNVDTRGIPVLMLTADAADGGERHGLDSGADGYVQKDSDPAMLLLRIRSLLHKVRAGPAVLGHVAPKMARVLVIDDSATYRTFLQAALEEDGASVVLADGGLEGIAVLQAGDFDCVLVDLVMPDLDGIAVCERIADLRGSMPNPPAVLILTTQESKEDMTRGLGAGADDFVGKSSDLAVLKARIRALLRRRSFQEENARILRELKEREVETARERAAKELAEARAALAGQLEHANRELAAKNDQLQRTQAQLVQSEKMASLGQLVAGIAHEINNPLAFVLSNVFSAARDLRELAGQPGEPGRRLDSVRELLTDALGGIERVRDLVQKLRTFSRLDEGRMKTVDVHESIDAALLFLHHRTRDRIEVVRDYRGPRQLTCLAGELNQVVMNLLANAIDAIEGPGRITVRTSARDGSFVIAVADTGRGIPAAVRPRIFEPFFTTKPVGQGTGLGLAISYGIVLAHHGTIDVRSEPGQGTEFLVSLPLDLERRRP